MLYCIYSLSYDLRNDTAETAYKKWIINPPHQDTNSSNIYLGESANHALSQFRNILMGESL